MAEDNVVEQLLRSGPEMSGYNGTEAEIEEVDYDETDEDIQDVQGPSHGDRDAKRWATPVSSGESPAHPAAALQHSCLSPCGSCKDSESSCCIKLRGPAGRMKCRAEDAPAESMPSAICTIASTRHSLWQAAAAHKLLLFSVQASDSYGRVLQQGGRRLRAACTKQQCHWVNHLTTRQKHYKEETAMAMPCKASQQHGAGQVADHIGHADRAQHAV